MRRIKRTIVLPALVAGLVLLVATVATASTSRSALQIIPPASCGRDVVFKKQDPDGVLAKLSPAVRALYNVYPYEVRATPWATFKGKKGPWKIGYVSFPTDNPWKISMFSQLKKEFAAAKAKGLVEGSLQTYIQPSWATATPEQQSSAIQQMVRNGVDAILVHPLNAIAETPAFDAAGKAGVPIILTSDVAPNSKYAVNVFWQNNSPAYAGTLAKMKAAGSFKPGTTTNVLEVRGIAGVTVEEAFYNASVADLKACPGTKIVGTVWGKWNPATAKAEVLKFLASHPEKIDLVFQSSVGAGVIAAFQEAGRPIPAMSFGGSSGGDLAWLADHKSDYKLWAGGQFGGFQVANTTLKIAMRILAGKGLKSRDIHFPVPLATTANIDQYATPGKPLTWIGDIRGNPNKFATNQVLNPYFTKPGTPGGL
jgi:ribose transport system substrate-binding protein